MLISSHCGGDISRMLSKSEDRKIVTAESKGGIGTDVHVLWKNDVAKAGSPKGAAKACVGIGVEFV